MRGYKASLLCTNSLSKRCATRLPPWNPLATCTELLTGQPPSKSEPGGREERARGFFQATFALGSLEGTRNRSSSLLRRGRMVRAAYCAFPSNFEGTMTSASTVQKG